MAIMHQKAPPAATIQHYYREALKAFCFVSVSVLVFKKKPKPKQDDIIMFRFCFGQVSVRLPFSH